MWGALAFAAQEWLQSRFPLNGFPWGRVAFGQVEGPFLPLAAIGGAPLVSVAVVAAGFCVAAFLQRPRRVVGLVPVVAVVLVAEHRGIKPSDMSRVNMAFFTMNGVVSFAMLVCTLIDLYLT